MTDLRVRVVEGEPDHWPRGFMRAQVRNSTDEVLRFADTVPTMLTSLAGVRPSEAIGQLWWRHLLAVVQGGLPGGRGRGTHSDPLTGLLGEILGPILAILCASSGAAWEILRVLDEPHNESRPDFILLNRDDGSLVVQECKGVTTDADKVVAHNGRLEVCGDISEQYEEGRGKFNKDLRPHKWEVEHRLTLIADGEALPFPTGKLLVSVVAISDGRLGKLNASVQHVSDCGMPCTQRCVVRGTNGIIVGVLAATDLAESAGASGPSGQRFPILDAYKACERALWQGSGAALGSAYAGLLAATRQAEYGDDAIVHSAAFLISPLEAAAAQGVAVDMSAVMTSAEQTRMPASFVDALRYWQGRQPAEGFEPPRETNVSEMGRMLGRSGEERPRATRGEWVLRDPRERPVHLHLQDTPMGRLVRLSPREPLSFPDEAAEDMRRLTAKLLSATMDIPVSTEWFTPQTVSLMAEERPGQSGERDSFRLGWALSHRDLGPRERMVLDWCVRRGELPGPMAECPIFPPRRHIWEYLERYCLRCEHLGTHGCWWPWLPFSPMRAWVSYDARAELWLP